MHQPTEQLFPHKLARIQIQTVQVPIPRTEVNLATDNGRAAIHAAGHIVIALGSWQTWPGGELPPQLATYRVQAVHVAIKAAENNAVIASSRRTFDIRLALERPVTLTAAGIQTVKQAVIVADVQSAIADTRVTDKAIFAGLRIFSGREAPAQAQRRLQRSFGNCQMIGRLADHFPAPTVF
ncbi:hypothetical protein HRbin36_02647 [bacterium HR36]|nr:hypothetical protein HRbin36_02647 [bacterium HR36]